MVIPVTDILSRAEQMLQDPGHVRWQPSVLVGWINDCTADISNNFQNAVSVVLDLRLVVGTQQTLPETTTNLLEVFCNIEMIPDPDNPGEMLRMRRRTITPTDRTAMDNLGFDWQNPDIISYSQRVQSVIDDPASSRSYLVFPGNDGTGRMEALVAQRPVRIVVEVPDPNNPPDLDDVNSYVGLNVDLDRKYITAVVDFVVGRCFGSDVDVPNAFNRMQYYMQSYMQRMSDSEFTDQARTPKEAPTVAVATTGVAP